MNRATENDHQLQAKAGARGQALQVQAGKGYCSGQNTWASLRHGLHQWWKRYAQIMVWKKLMVKGKKTQLLEMDYPPVPSCKR